MADYDSALPVRSQTLDGDTVNAENGIFLVGGTDGTNYQALSVDSAGRLNVNSGATAWDDTNKVVIWNETTGLAIETDGSINVNASVDAGGTIGLEAGTESIGSVDINSGQSVGIDAGTADIGVVHLTDGTTELDVAVDGSAAKTNGIQILGTDGVNAQVLKTDSNGQLYVLTDGSPDDAVTYGTASLVKDTAATIVTKAGAANVAKVMASGSGLFKCEVKYGTTGSEAVIAVLINSTANPNVELEFPNGLQVAAGESMLLSCTNLEKKASPGSDFSGYGSIINTA